MTESTLDQAEIISRMVRLPHRQHKKIKAIIGLGDLVNGSIKRVFDQVGIKPGEIPVVGWGNSLDTTQEVLDGYVDRRHSGRIRRRPAMWRSRSPPWQPAAFRPGFNVITGALYEKATLISTQDPLRQVRSRT